MKQEEDDIEKIIVDKDELVIQCGNGVDLVQEDKNSDNSNGNDASISSQDEEEGLQNEHRKIQQGVEEAQPRSRYNFRKQPPSASPHSHPPQIAQESGTSPQQRQHHPGMQQSRDEDTNAQLRQPLAQGEEKPSVMQPSWDESYRELKAYAQTHGHCRVPFVGKSRRLAMWMVRQRKRKRLGPDQRCKLDAIVEFDWKGVSRCGSLVREDKIWFDSYDCLKKFKLLNGNCMVPQIYKDDPKLGLWVKNQRQKKERISKEQRDLLDKIGFVWKMKSGDKPARDYSKTTTKNDEKWESMLDCLLRYRAKHGNCQVKCNDKDASLYHWVLNQRKEYHQKTYCGDKRSMRLDRKEQLEAIGFDWGNKDRQTGQASMEQLTYGNFHM